MTEQSGGGPITREQVERAIDDARADRANSNSGLLPMSGNLGENWRGLVPDYVNAAWSEWGWDATIAALTRWRDELAAAEPVRRVARWVESTQDYRLSTPHVVEDTPERYHMTDVATRAQAIAWGYEIEGGPEPVAHHAASERVVERLRAMTSAEALAALVEAGIVTPDGELTEAYRARPEEARLAAKPRPHMTPAFRKVIAEMRAGGASLSEVADAYSLGIGEVSEALDAESMAPERPAPRFKVGDWVRRQSHAGCTEPFRIAKVTPIAVDPPGTAHATYCYAAESSHAPTLERALEPASPPAPEVVDVPQPRVLVKRCDEVEAEWTSADATILIVTHDALDDAIFVPLALLRAMLEAIDAQRGGAS